MSPFEPDQAIQNNAPISSKARLRQWALDQRKALPIEAISKSIQTRLTQWSFFQNAQVILTYWALPGEVCLQSVIKDWPEKQWFLPRIEPEAAGETEEASALVFHRFYPNDCLETHPYGIQEPFLSAPRLKKTSPVDLIILPALAYDQHGYRLGYGKGFYDRYLTGPQIKSQLIGVLPEACLLDKGLSFPRDPWDIPVHHVFTEKRILSFQNP